MRIALIQYAFGPHIALLELTKPKHKQMCDRHSIEYYCYEYQPQGHPYWEKPAIIARTLLHGFDKVIWLDADTLWINGNIAEANQTHSLGMTWHHLEDPSHYNAGAIYINNSKETVELVQEWLATPDDGHKWADQYALNKILNETNTVRLGHEWNAMSIYPSDNPNVLAWHGCGGNCFTQMREAVHAFL